MKLIHQTKLFFQDAKSDKVYEVDLCEAGTNQYLVNFRYGKRGGNLKEGTKTSSPVDRTKADQIFNKLVGDKKKKGYQEQGAVKEPVYWDDDGFNAGSSNKETLLYYVKKVVEQKKALTAYGKKDKQNRRIKSDWGTVVAASRAENKPVEVGEEKTRHLSRIVWRIGELRIKEAVPYLLRLPKNNNTVDQYSLVWTLGRCGEAAALPFLDEVFERTKLADTVKIMAYEAKWAIIKGTDQAEELIKTWRKKIPAAFLAPVQAKDADALVDVINKQLNKKKTAYEEIALLYLLSDTYPVIKKALLKWVDTVKLKGEGRFKSIRQLYKAAEFRDDAQLFGRINYRISKDKHYYVKSSWSRYGSIPDPNKDPWNWQRYDVSKEMASGKSRLGFSARTKPYLTKRTWRTLKNRAANEQEANTYVKLATGILLCYTDDDRDRLRSQTFYTYGYVDGRWRSQRRRVNYTPYSNFTLFSAILFSNSERFEWGKSKTNWVLKEGVSRETALAFVDKREEAFSELWDQLPQAGLHLLAESQCKDVHEFAIKLVKTHYAALVPLVDANLVRAFLGKRYEQTALLGLSLAQQKYDPENPDIDLLLALIQSPLLAARVVGMDLLKKQKDLFLKDTGLILELLFTNYEDVQTELKALLKEAHLSEERKVGIVGGAMARMLAFGNEATEQNEAIILQVGSALTELFGDTVGELEVSVIEECLAHPLPSVKVFGAKILMQGNKDAGELSEEVVLNLINGVSPEMREMGVKLLSKYSDKSLIEQQEMLKALCLSEHREIRKAVQPIIGRLAKVDESFGKHFTQVVALHLLKKEVHEGRDEDIDQLLKNQLVAYLPTLPKRRILQLLHSPRMNANILGSYLLDNFVESKDLKMRQIVRLASHEMEPVRRWTWNMYENNVARIKYEVKEAVRMMDAKWDDSRDFSFDYFAKHFEQKDWEPEILVSICDSVNPAVQQFGKQLITKFFKDKDGERYLLQLSQHPTADLQQFATNYLDRFAADRPEHIEELELYFTTVLSGVNKSSVAKKRIFEFLEKEALKEEKVAEIVARILTRQSAMMVIRDKAKCIEILLKIKKRYPNLDTPIQLKAVDTYEG